MNYGKEDYKEEAIPLVLFNMEKRGKTTMPFK